MANNIQVLTESLLKELTARAFGEKRRYIVDTDNSLPVGLTTSYAIILEATTGFTCDDIYKIKEGADYPEILPVGMELPGGLQNIEVGQGRILCFLTN